MPVSVVKTEREEHLWEKAKERAREEGHGDDWQYVMGIYKNMNPSRFKKEASYYVIKELLKRASCKRHY